MPLAISHHRLLQREATSARGYGEGACCTSQRSADGTDVTCLPNGQVLAQLQLRFLDAGVEVGGNDLNSSLDVHGRPTPSQGKVEAGNLS